MKIRIHPLPLVALCLPLVSLPLHAQSTLYWDGDGIGSVGGGTGTWDTTLARWSTTSNGTTYQAWDNTAPTDNAVFQNNSGTVTMGSDITVRSLSFDKLVTDTTGYSLVGPSYTLTFDGGIGSINTISGTHTISANIAGDDGLTKIGLGTLILSGDNSYAGKTEVLAGELILTGSNSYSGGTNIHGGLVQFTSADNLGSGELRFANAGTLQWAAGNTLDISDRLYFGPSGDTSATFDTNGNDVTFASDFTNKSSLIKEGLGTLTLTGTDSLGTSTGGITVKQGTVAIGATGAVSVGSLSVGDTSGDVGALEILGGSLSGGGTLGNAVGSQGTVTVTSGTWTNPGGLIVGSQGTGSLLINGGTVSNEIGYIAANTSGSGSATVTSGTWTNSLLYVGYRGTGSLLVDGGTVSNTAGYLGNDAGSSGSATVTSGTWTNSGNLRIGVNGTGELLINGGTVSDTNGQIGFSLGGIGSVTVSSGTWTNSIAVGVGINGTGTLLINGGTVSDDNGNIGQQAGSNGSATVTSGTWTNFNRLTVGNNGTGSLAVDGGLVTVTGITHIGGFDTGNGNGTLTLSDTSGNRGTLSTNQILEGLGTGTLTFDGGILQARVDQSNFISAFEDGDVTINAGGAFIDSNSFSIGISAQLSGTGGLTKQGLGTLTLSVANTYQGDTTVEGGTLTLAHNNAAGSGGVIVNAGTLHIGEGFAPTNAITLAGGYVVRDFGTGADLTNAITATSSLAGGTDTTVVILGGSTSTSTTLSASFAALIGAENDSIRQSDVLSLSGVPVVNIGTGETDLFVLQLQIGSLDANSILGWFNPVTNAWVNAVDGNFGGTSTFLGDVAYNPGTDFVLGYYGIDTANNSVWAVINHNSEFSVVAIPEPSAFAMLGCTLGGLLLLRRRA